MRCSYQLVARGGAGLACDKDGLALGAMDLASVRLDTGGMRRCEVRSPGEIGRILQTAYGPQPDGVVLRLHRGLRRAAASIEAGDIGRAGVEAVKLGVPDLTPVAMAKLADIADLEKANTAWRTEPRIPRGQAGGGQWTTDGGAGGTAVGGPAERPQGSSAGSGAVAAEASASGGAGGFNATDRRLLVHVSTAATVVGDYGPPDDVALPKGVARLGRAGLLVFGAALLDGLDARSAQEQVANAVARFGLDPGRPADVTAASAYVWSRYALPMLTEAPFRGAALDAASQAVMRFVLVNPGAFVAMRQNSKSSQLIIAAANGGLADYASESRARPAGVDPKLQTTSRSARAAIADELQSKGMDAHHLVPANVWERYKYIADLAYEAEWRVDSPSNLIALPNNEKTWEEFGGTLPMHRGGHIIYSASTVTQIELARSLFPAELSPLQARAILDSVALRNRMENPGWRL